MDLEMAIAKTAVRLGLARDEVTRLEFAMQTMRDLSTGRDAPAATRQRSKSQAREDIVQTENEVMAILQAANGPVRTRDLLEIIKARGVNVGGRKEVSNLSVRLARSGLFDVSTDGWRIKNSGTLL